MTGTVLVYLGLVLAPTTAFYLARRGLERLTTWSGPRRQQASVEPSLERFRHHLRRLDAEYARLEGSASPGTRARLRSVSMAYDDTLVACCRALDVPPPGTPPLPAATRLQTEALLAARGLTW